MAEDEKGNWYERSFYLLHEDHHTRGGDAVGKDADPVETARLVALSRPDVVQIHAKGNPGWTTYPSVVGHTPPSLARDMLAVWRDLARREGYHWSIYYNLGRDGEIMRRRPEWNRIAVDGTLVDRALCYHSGVAEGYLWPMIAEEMKEYRPQGFWLDGTCFITCPCYCDRCRMRFKREVGGELPPSADSPGWSSFQAMQRQIFREFVRGTCERIHAIDPGCLVAVNHAYSWRMPERPDPGLAYLTGDIGNHVDRLSPAAHFYDGQGLPFDLMTQICTLQKGAGERSGMRPKPQGQIEQEMALVVANGGRFFAWDDPTVSSGLVAANHEFLGRVVAPFLRARQPFCLGSKRSPDVSVLHSAVAHYAVTVGRRQSFSGGGNYQIEGAASALVRHHLDYEMVPDWRLKDKDVRSRILIIEDPVAMDCETIGPLCDWVRDGGRLLVSGRALAIDSRLRALAGWDECVAGKGMETVVLSDDPAVEFRRPLHRGRTGSARTMLSVKDAAGREAAFLTVNEVGKGKVYYAAVPFLTAPFEDRRVQSRILSIVVPDEDRQVLSGLPPVPQTVEAIVRRQGDRTILHLVNYAPGNRMSSNGGQALIEEIPAVPAFQVRLRVPADPASIRLEPQGVELVARSRSDGLLVLDIPSFAIHQMVVISP